MMFDVVLELNNFVLRLLSLFFFCFVFFESDHTLLQIVVIV